MVWDNNILGENVEGNQRRVVVWFSCGAASAVAARLAIMKYGADRVVIYYMDTGSEHPDSKRFMKDVEKWLGKQITTIRSEKYKNIWDVIELTKYVNSPQGARCTTELKRLVARQVSDLDDINIYGYTLEEATVKRSYKTKEGYVKLTRCENFERNNPEKTVDWILAEHKLAKKDCLALLMSQEIVIPEMYRLGYKNNNCIGCVKGGKGYWNKIRKDFPDTFSRMAKIERTIGRTVFNGIYLDELDPNAGRYKDEEMPSCGITCGDVEVQIMI